MPPARRPAASLWHISISSCSSNQRNVSCFHSFPVCRPVIQPEEIGVLRGRTALAGSVPAVVPRINPEAVAVRDLNPVSRHEDVVDTVAVRSERIEEFGQEYHLYAHAVFRDAAVRVQHPQRDIVVFPGSGVERMGNAVAPGRRAVPEVPLARHILRDIRVEPDGGEILVNDPAVGVYRHLRQIVWHVLEVRETVLAAAMGFRNKLNSVNPGIRILVESLFRAVHRPVPHIPLPGVHPMRRVEEEAVPVRAAVVQQESDAALYLFLFGKGQGDDAVAIVYCFQAQDVRTGFGDVEAVSGVRASLAEHPGQLYVVYRMDGKVQAVYAVALVYGPQGIVIYAALVQTSAPEIDGIALADALREGVEIVMVNVQFQCDDAVAFVDGLQRQAVGVGAALPDIGEVETVSVIPLRRADGITDGVMVHGVDGQVQCDNAVTTVDALQVPDVRAGSGDMETVQGINIPLANGVVQLNVVQWVYGEEEGADGIAIPGGFQGVADYRIGGDGSKVEAIAMVVAAVAYRIGERKVRGRMYGQCQPENAVTAVDGGEGIVIHTTCVQASAPEIDGIPLTDALECSIEIGPGNVQMQRDGAVASVDSGICFRKRTAGSPFGKVETVTVVAVTLADGIMKYLVVYGMHSKGEGTDGIATQRCLQGVADYRIGSDDRKVETVVVVVAAVAYRIGEMKVMDRMYGQRQPVNAVATVDGGKGIVIHTSCVQASAPEINGIPLADVLQFGNEVGLGNVQMQRDGAVATMDSLQSLCLCYTFSHGCQIQTVLIIAVPPANGIIHGRVIYLPDLQMQHDGGVASRLRKKRQGIYIVFLHIGQRETVLVIGIPLAERIVKECFVWLLHGQMQIDNAVATCHRAYIQETVCPRFRPDVENCVAPCVGQILGANNDRSVSDDIVTIRGIPDNATDGKAIVFCHH